MLRKSQRRLCYILSCLLLISGMYMTFEKADSIARHAVASETARIQKPDRMSGQKTVYVVERTGSLLREAVGRVVSRNYSLRRDLRFPSLFLCALCVAYFVLRYWNVEEILFLHKKKYREALIKYIHDIDGKKRMSCLT